jgi:hypothetical protein
MSSVVPSWTNPSPPGCTCNAGTSWHALDCPAGKPARADHAATLAELLRLLGRARRALDAVADGVTVDAHFRESCGILADHITATTGHSITDQPPSAALQELLVALGG